jgi:hypothetical protein
MSDAPVKRYIGNKCKVIHKKETKEIKCCNNSCKKTLAFLADSETTGEVLYHLVIKCPFCGGRSYDFDVHGTLAWVMPDDVKFSNIKEDDKNHRVIWETTR